MKWTEFLRVAPTPLPCENGKTGGGCDDLSNDLACAAGRISVGVLCCFRRRAARRVASSQGIRSLRIGGSAAEKVPRTPRIQPTTQASNDRVGARKRSYYIQNYAAPEPCVPKLSQEDDQPNIQNTKDK